MTPFTIPSFYEIFLHKKSIDDGIYHTGYPKFNATNSDVIAMIQANGYQFKYIGNEHEARLFEEQYAVANYTYNSSCIRGMHMLQLLLSSEKPVFYILHALTETHNPYLCGDIEHGKWYEWPGYLGDTEEDAMEQMKKALAYWDAQLSFYMDFLSPDATKVFMSDHGKRYHYLPIYKTVTTHVLFFIQRNDIAPKRCMDMFSLYDFDKVTKYLLDAEKDESSMFSDYVCLQETNIFNATAVQYYIEHNAEENACAFRAVRTKEELYVKISTGVEYYYLLPDEECNHIYEIEYSERIKELDQIAGDKFENATDFEEELKRFRKTYEAHE